MNKLFLILFCCLFIHTAASSQEQDTLPPRTDTVRPQQTNVDSAVRRVIAPRRRDTSSRPRPDTTAIRQIDSARRADSLQLATASQQERDILSAVKALLDQHPYFSFFGKAVNLVAIKRNEQGKEMFFYILLGLFFYLAMVKTLFPKYLTNLVSIFLRITLRQQQLREQLLQAPLPSLMLNIFFLLIGGFYASLLLEYYNYEAHSNFWLQTVYCVGILALIYLGKFIILKFTGWVFNLTKATDTYIFIVFLVNKMLGMMLLPFLVLIAFYTGQPQQVFVTLSLILIIVLFAYRFIFSFGPIRTEIKVNPFHFFLYLCAFEIAPLLLIYKVLLSIVQTNN